MRFLCLYKPSRPERSEPPNQDEMAKMAALIEEGMRKGWLLATEGCLPSAQGARVRLSDGKFTITDGPFSESKEIVGGVALIRADSKEECIQLTRDFLKIAGDGETEIRQVYDTLDCAGPKVSELLAHEPLRA